MMTLFRSLNRLRKDCWQAVTSGRKAATVKIYAADASRRHDLASHPALATTPMRVVAVVTETPTAISLTLARQDGADIDFLPGMFFTLVLRIDGQEYRRAYSISSAASERRSATITIKRVADGVVSNHLAENIAVGARLDVLGPTGNFTVKPEPGACRELLLVGGGSGITPLMAILRSVLATESGSRITLFYGNRQLDEVIFAASLNALEKQYGERLRVWHVLELPPADWSGDSGRLDAERFSRLLTCAYGEHLPADLTVWQCGPAPMMEGVRAQWLARGLPEPCLHQENFTPGLRPPAAGARLPQPITIIDHNGGRWQGQIAGDQSLLDAGLDLGAPMSFSCTLGGCGRCRVRVLAGDIDMPEPNGLLPEERAQGYALACIASACSPLTIAIEAPTPN